MSSTICNRTDARHDNEDPQGNHLTLTEATKVAPGRPSTNCMWRWCRRGVLARSGERVRLRHVRIGGKIFTTAGWLEAFGHTLAEADQRYFKLRDDPPEPPNRMIRSPRQASGVQARRPTDISEIERELEREGI